MSKWNDLINRYNPDEDDLCDLLDEAEKIGRANAIEEFREYLKTIEPCAMPQDFWNIGVDNTCNRMLKEQSK